MKNCLLVITFLFGSVSMLFSQNESFVHCFGNDTIFVEKIAENISGDTVIKSYQYALNNIDPNFYYEFDYYLFNDSIFSKYNGRYYLVGDNNAQVGDVWQSLLYLPFFEPDSADYSCTGLMNMEVSSITQVSINGTPTNYVHLINIDYETGESEDYAFLAGIGATIGGPLYNFIQLYPCSYISDGPPNALFKSYSVSGFTYLENSECPNNGGIGVKEVFEDLPSMMKSGNFLEIQNASNSFMVKIYDLSGRELMESHEVKIDVSHLDGVYFVRLIQSSTEKMVKFYF